MARRRNAVAHRFARIRGLPPEEKALMQRIGHLMDAALNNRQASNPFEQSQARTNRQVYPPTGLLTQTGISSVKILWDATPSNELLRYEVEFINLTTGLSETKTSFTNEITYKGADGTYLARVKSVGRDGSSSTIRQVSFGMGDDVMLLEGAKNDATELGTLVQDNIKLYDGWSVYVWGSCVLDKYMLQTNNRITFRLWRADVPDASFGQAYLVETITLYRGTESGTNLDSTARGGNITRPAGTRAGSYETSQSVMFSPQQVDTDDDEKTVTFFLQAVNRELEDDEVCLSLVLWSGADGIGTSIPGNDFRARAPHIFPHFNSFHKTGSPTGNFQTDFPYDTRSWHATLEDGYSLVGNRWTIAMWVRFDNLDGNNMGVSGSVDGGDQQLFNRDKIDFSGGQEDRPNKITTTLSATVGAQTGCDSQTQHHFPTVIFDYRSGTPQQANIVPDGQDRRVMEFLACCFGDRNEKSGIFPWGDAQSAPSSIENNAWYFIVWCFEGGNFVNHNLPKLRVYMNTAVMALTGEPAMALMLPPASGAFNSMYSGVTQNDEGSMAYLLEAVNDGQEFHYFLGVYNGDLYSGPTVTAGTQYSTVGIWNVALDSTVNNAGSNIGPIQTLFNEGRGWAVDWRRNSTQYDSEGPFGHLNYVQSENLCHYLQSGAVEEPFATHQAGRDTGYFLPSEEGELNWTFDRSDLGYDWHEEIGAGSHPHTRFLGDGQGGFTYFDNLPQSWARGTDIYDILSPLGTNNTTEYDFAYPGQHLSGNGTITQDNGDYPSFSDWVEAGSDLSILPWLSGPFSPGYHKDDPDRPIEGGV
jgi:hypothetical protein